MVIATITTDLTTLRVRAKTEKSHRERTAGNIIVVNVRMGLDVSSITDVGSVTNLVTGLTSVERARMVKTGILETVIKRTKGMTNQKTEDMEELIEGNKR